MLELLILFRTATSLILELKGKIEVYYKNLVGISSIWVNLFQCINHLNIWCHGEDVYLLFHKVDNITIKSWVL